MGLLDTLTTMGVDSVSGLGEHLTDTEKLGQIGLSPENYNVISAMNAADNMNSGITGLMAPAALYTAGDTMFNSNQSLPEGISDLGRYMKGVNIQSNPELAKELMGQNYVNQMQGKYALAMDQIGKGIFGKGPNPDLYNQSSSTPQNLGFIEDAPQIKEAIYQDRIMNPNLPGFMAAPSRFQGFKNQMSNFMNNPVTRGLGTALNFAKGSLPGMIMSGIGSLFSRNPNSPSYNSRTPGFDYNNLNESMINDFYDSNPDSDTFGTNRFDRAVPGSFGSFRTLAGYLNRNKTAAGKAAMAKEKQARKAAIAQEISRAAARSQQAAIERDIARDSNRGGGANQAGGGYSTGSGYNEGNFCFDPSTLIQMADGSTKEIKNIQLGDDTKGGEVTGVFQFKATDEIHDYKGVTVAGSHYVKEDGKFIMVKDSPLSVKIDKIPVVYSLDTTGRRIFINDIEFADYNGDGIAKGFLSNAGVDLTGFDTEVLRQVEQRLI